MPTRRHQIHSAQHCTVALRAAVPLLPHCPTTSHTVLPELESDPSRCAAPPATKGAHPMLLPLSPQGCQYAVSRQSSSKADFKGGVQSHQARNCSIALLGGWPARCTTLSTVPHSNGLPPRQVLHPDRTALKRRISARPRAASPPAAAAAPRHTTTQHPISANARATKASTILRGSPCRRGAPPCSSQRQEEEQPSRVRTQARRHAGTPVSLGLSPGHCGR
ncbi:hypothetical protein NDU88_002836 [Pleurodeles waltl]|uniref:Uncharacterized protein n=1 Tax=Pleurodeles waltl TaxID=8319 RepID=A0AAV7MRQ0_PLEWA|nr:hypothetical protein NDU88_002836 [Pleurodeles waltl]